MPTCLLSDRSFRFLCCLELSHHLLKVGNHLALRDLSRAVVIELSESLVEFIWSEVLFEFLFSATSHFSECIDTHLVAFLLVQVTAVVGVVVAPQRLNCLHDKFIGLR